MARMTGNENQKVARRASFVARDFQSLTSSICRLRRSSEMGMTRAAYRAGPRGGGKMTAAPAPRPRSPLVGTDVETCALGAGVALEVVRRSLRRRPAVDARRACE